MVFAYLALGLVLVFVVHLLLRFLTEAEPRLIRRAGKWVAGFFLVAVIFLLLRFGLMHHAAILSFASVAIPLVQRFRRAASKNNPSRDASSGAPSRNSAMTLPQARAILGVDAQADAAQIREAHRRLIHRNHPDAGGSEYLASQINEARDVLLKHLENSP